MLPNVVSRRLSQASFSITIKIDTLEAQRRIQNQYDRSFPAHRTMRNLVAVVDPDGLLWGALVALETDLEGAYDELQWRYLPERAFLAEGILVVERVFAKIKSLFRELETVGRESHAHEGLALRASRLISDIEDASNEIEEMRTQLLKEFAGPQMQLGGKRWTKSLAGCFGRKQDTSQAKRAEGVYPYPRPRQAQCKQTMDCRYYL